MIDYESFTLDNGLRVVVHTDHTAPLAVLNVLYNVGSRDESPNRTGFAHLFEHLMFGGSRHVPSYDEPLQRVGGDNNAFTTPDITNYYVSLPSANLETACWLESDRMLGLSFDERVLAVQQKVVIEEYHQRYLNQPYGDAWLHLNPLAYQKHPYRWPTIGQNIDHIAAATLDDVKAFFYRHYRPNNAVAVLAGDVTPERARALTEKWFGPIPAGEVPSRQLPTEPPQEASRVLEHRADVPLDALYRAYHAPARLDDDYYAADLISDLLGRGRASRLYQALVEERELFNDIRAYVTGAIDPGLVVIEGKISEGVAPEAAEVALDEAVARLRAEGPSEAELHKVKNQAEATLVFGEVELLNRAINLAYATVLGQPDLVNHEAERVQAVTTDDIRRNADRILRPENSVTLRYRRNA